MCQIRVWMEKWLSWRKLLLFKFLDIFTGSYILLWCMSRQTGGAQTATRLSNNIFYFPKRGKNLGISDFFIKPSSGTGTIIWDKKRFVFKTSPIKNSPVWGMSNFQACAWWWLYWKAETRCTFWTV